MLPILYELDHVDISFNSTRVLRGISLEVREGEYLGIVGPNGSGKSTLLRAMSGVLVPASGSVMLDGREVSGIAGREFARLVAVVPQESPVAFDYTVLEVVLMGRSPRLGRFEVEGRSDFDAALHALARTNLLHLADRRIGELSGGERQRTMIARALAQEAGVLLLDEPTAHLDINYQVEIMHLARRENAENGKTVVVVLHDLNLAAEFCDRLIMLRDGELFASGPPEDVITSENVRDAYGAAVWVRRHPTSGRPYVLSLGSRALASRLSDGDSSVRRLRVHVICGGGSGGQVFAALLESGCEVTAGVINIGDTDQEAAESLGIEYVEDAPFSPISEAATGANAEFIARADAVLIAEMPFGPGNLANLESALDAVRKGKPVAIMGSSASYRERDFSEGRAVALLQDLLGQGAAALESIDDVRDWVAKTGGA
jgi:iron complex transport system ATP-binding protein